ncbi:MAG: class I SAM-dependent methyltransferase [Flavobacteriia bacterium]|nr:MAG: class I SAM-dependent methyltransferase [Flavobacteriia bacterium]
MSFDKEAQNWDQNQERVDRAKVFAEEILSFIKPEKEMTAMEFGSGTGLLSEQMKDHFQSISLVDTSEGMIKVLKEKIAEKQLSNFHPFLTDLTKDPFSKKNIDVIYTSMTLHHIINLNQILGVFNSLLNKNGYLCIADLEKEDGTFHSGDGFEGHFGFDKEELTGLLSKNGFRVVYYTRPITLKKEREGIVKDFPLFLMIAQKIN